MPIVGLFFYHDQGFGENQQWVYSIFCNLSATSNIPPTP